MSSNRSSGGVTVLVLLILGLLALLFIGGLFWAGPQYSVYVQETQGKAQLAAAKYTKQIQEVNAQAKAIASEGEVTYITNVGQALQKYPAVLQKEYIQALQDAGVNGDRTVVYVPVNPSTGIPQIGDVPVTEAGRAVNKG